MSLLAQFLLRLSFGLATGMAITSSKQVTSGYFRNHLYVTLGLTCLAALLIFSTAPTAFWWAVTAAAASYVGAVCWLYEMPSAGKVALVIVAFAALTAAGLETVDRREHDPVNWASKYSLFSIDTQEMTTAEARSYRQKVDYLLDGVATAIVISLLASGLLLGITMAAMLLGHWYLNSPTMELKPLYRLLVAMAVAVGLRTIVSGWGLWAEVTNLSQVNSQWILFVILRWIFGLVGVAALIWMTWQTLKVPNTQSATGLLYVAVIGTFIGETMALLLSAESLFPL